MKSLRHYVDVTADDASQDWTVNYGPTAHGVVERSSATTDYISSNTVGHLSDFVCGAGPSPRLGFVSAVTVGYRVRATTLNGAPRRSL